MARSLRFVICLFLGVWLCGKRLCADRPAVAPGTELVDVQFTVFSQERLHGLCYFPRTVARPVSLEFFTQARSVLHRYRGPVGLAFYEEASVPSQAKGERPPPVAIARIPARVKRVLILFFPLPVCTDDGRKYATYVVEESLQRLPAGHVVVLNASGREYVAELARRSFSLPPGLSETVPAGGRVVRLKLAAQFNEQWFRAGSHEFKLGADARACVVLFPPASPTGLNPLIRVLVDEVPAVAR